MYFSSSKTGHALSTSFLRPFFWILVAQPPFNILEIYCLFFFFWCRTTQSEEPIVATTFSFFPHAGETHSPPLHSTLVTPLTAPVAPEELLPTSFRLHASVPRVLVVIAVRAVVTWHLAVGCSLFVCCGDRSGGVDYICRV